MDAERDEAAVELRMVAVGPERERWAPLLELADEPVPLRAYLQQGDLYGLVRRDGSPRAAILVILQNPETAELRAVAVAEREQGRGIGSRMLAATMTVLAARGVRTVVVGTASSGVRQLAFYQRLGFRLSRVERDYFTEVKGYPPGLTEHGIPVRDMVWMDLALAPSAEV